MKNPAKILKFENRMALSEIAPFLDWAGQDGLLKCGGAVWFYGLAGL